MLLASSDLRAVGPVRRRSPWKASAPKVQVGPYLFGAQSDGTPVRMKLRDMDRDGALDVVLDIDNEWLVYLNKDGGLRLPTDDEQRRMAQLSGQEGDVNGTQ